MRMWSRVLLVMALLWVPSVTVTPSVEAQAAPAQRQELERRVRRAFQNRVREDLQLTQAEGQSLAEVIRWSEMERRGIAQRTRELNAEVTLYLRDGGEDAARSILQSRRALQQEEADLFAQEQERLLTVLSPNQVVRFYRLRDQFNRQLQQARARRAGNGGIL